MRFGAMEGILRRSGGELVKVARQIGFDLREGFTGGGSDGSYCAALGVPILDGLGVEGEGAHAEIEGVRTDRIAWRAAFLGSLLEQVEGA